MLEDAERRQKEGRIIKGDRPPKTAEDSEEVLSQPEDPLRKQSKGSSDLLLKRLSLDFEEVLAAYEL